MSYERKEPNFPNFKEVEFWKQNHFLLHLQQVQLYVFN
jgi:hypothetical protein